MCGGLILRVHASHNLTSCRTLALFGARAHLHSSKVVCMRLSDATFLCALLNMISVICSPVPLFSSGNCVCKCLLVRAVQVLRALLSIGKYINLSYDLQYINVALQYLSLMQSPYALPPSHPAALRLSYNTVRTYLIRREEFLLN